jgi:hypothetical protein
MAAVLPTTPSQIRALRQPPGPATYTVKDVAALLGLHLTTDVPPPLRLAAVFSKLALAM